MPVKLFFAIIELFSEKDDFLCFSIKKEIKPKNEND